MTAAALVTLWCGACKTPAPPPPERMLEPLSRAPARAPEAADYTAAALAEASLAGDRAEAERLVARLHDDLGARESIARRRGVEVLIADDDRAALVPLGIDLANAAVDDPRRYRELSRMLLAHDDLNAAHRARLEQAVDDEPLRLAGRRNLERYESLWAQTFNAISRPLGRSLLTGLTTAPFEISMSVVHYLAGMLERPPVDTRERQALGHWKQFLARYPDAPEAAEVRERAERTQRELDEMHRDRFVAAAERTLESGRPAAARLHARRASLHAPADSELDDLFARIDAALAREHRTLAAVHAASPDVPLRDRDRRDLIEALWIDTPAESLARMRHERARARDGALADELDYVLATAQHELGAEGASWDRLAEIAREPDDAHNMPRHARAVLFDPWQNPRAAFEREKVRSRSRAATSEVFGRFALGPRYQAIPEELAYLIDAPVIAQRALSTPFRLLLSPFSNGPKRDFQRGAAVLGYRYLDRFPDGEHRRDQIQWLFDYEDGRGNALAALELADAIPGFDRDARSELAERAADQQLSGAVRMGRRDFRARALRGVALEFPDSLAGAEAGRIARNEADEATPQRIRLTRGFLRENPQIAGPRGLAIDGALTDGEIHNGELHPAGVTFLGGRVLEVALVAESGDEDDPPERIRTRIHPERLARSVALVEQAATLGVRIDRDEHIGADGSRDHYFERAMLGLTDEPDTRPTAESTYVYQGLAERYGIVRGRESILPFDLVLQGSVSNLGLAAFPRWREPEETPDAFLYR